jgi:hypothetical protein
MNNYADELRNYEEEAESRYNDYDEDSYEDMIQPVQRMAMMKTHSTMTVMTTMMK